ncbi:histidinol-phosphatase [Halobacillus andaensis]|uniref:Histidinol-phosphatase n=1 Tax=Halobacillus andaensis TaxID=1176239 RepID=A0A917EUE3_HALAA|nr:histidinol-phosphatase HisJ [Halobacillus andaensis]MBP2002831.1 histidinol-phosphatase (PHP family) [Halobacillus andaensis]GGF06036.1 histidinol-phosphatase [Halobacillus andaensis]
MNDGHIHTPYCPHGSEQPLEAYVKRAITLGYSSMTFTEHAPLPPSFIDPVPNQDSAMRLNDVEDYIQTIHHLKKAYESDIDIRLGFEIDYIKGYEDEIRSFLNEYGPYIDDSILSVHFLKAGGQWYCIDYNPEMFKEAVDASGSIEELYHLYYQTMEQSVLADLGTYKPNRIGHMTLIKKFQLLYDPPENWHQLASLFLDTVKKQGMSLDYNGAGAKKSYCLESYPPLSIATLASSKNILLVYGSDAHHPDQLKQGFSELNQSLIVK